MTPSRRTTHAIYVRVVKLGGARWSYAYGAQPCRTSLLLGNYTEKKNYSPGVFYGCQTPLEVSSNTQIGVEKCCLGNH